MMRFPSLTASYACCKIQIGYLEQRLAERDITLEVTDAALDLLGEAGFDPIYGARPLKRAIQQDLNSLAQDILAGKIGPDDVVTADAENGRIVFSVISEAK